MFGTINVKFTPPPHKILHLVTCCLFWRVFPVSVLDCFMLEDGVVGGRVEAEAFWMNNWGSAVRQRTAGRLFWWQ